MTTAVCSACANRAAPTSAAWSPFTAMDVANATASASCPAHLADIELLARNDLDSPPSTASTVPRTGRAVANQCQSMVDKTATIWRRRYHLQAA